MSLLQVDNLTLRFGGLTAVNKVSFTMKPGQIMAVIGPNGAGKTSLFNAISGVYTPDTGTILLNGKTASRPLTGKTIVGLVAAALFTMVFFVVLVNVEALWEAAISMNYVYQEAFPWGAAFQSVITYLRETEARYVLGTGLLGLMLGAASFYVVWWRGRFAPHVAAAAGLARTFQNPRLFYEMSVLENAMATSANSKSPAPWPPNLACSSSTNPEPA
jgi:branched-chain amino acid transport system ATP-binding protein